MCRAAVTLQNLRHSPRTIIITTATGSLAQLLPQREHETGYQSGDAEAFLESAYANPDAPIPVAASKPAAAAATAGAATAATAGAGDAASGSAGGAHASGTSTPRSHEELNSRLALLERLIGASRAIASELDPLQATNNIVAEACKLLDADRATLFRMTAGGKELELMVAEGASGIRVPVGRGIAGTVAASGKLENIRDAYEDDRFDPSFDKKSGYRTQSVLACPVQDSTGTTVGVLQIINKLSNVQDKSSRVPFDEVDEELALILAAQAGIALRNAQLYESSTQSEAKVKALIDVIKSMHNNLGINSLMFTITQRAPALVGADRCTFFLANHAANELWAMQGDVDIRIPIDKGIAGAVAIGSKTVNIADAYEDARFNQAVDKSSGYRTRQILCMPLLRTAHGAQHAGAASAGAPGADVVGVIQLINKKGTDEAFTEADEELVGTFLTLAAPIIESSTLYQAHMDKKAKAEESGAEFSGGDVLKRTTREAAPAAPIIEEGDEDEDDDEDDEEEA